MGGIEGFFAPYVLEAAREGPLTSLERGKARAHPPPRAREETWRAGFSAAHGPWCFVGAGVA